MMMSNTTTRRNNDDDVVNNTNDNSDDDYSLEYFPSIEDPLFNEKIFDRQEFYFTSNHHGPDRIKIPLYQLEPHQMFVKNFLSPSTPYNGLLLFYGTGSGKTCASLQIAEQFKPYLAERGGRIIVLGRSGSHVENIFKREMYDTQKELREIDLNLPSGSTHCLGETYLNKTESSLIDESSIVLHRNNYKTVGVNYEFYGYSKFASVVSQLEKNNIFLDEYFANCIFIVDEAHNFAGLDVSDQNDNNNTELIAYETGGEDRGGVEDDGSSPMSSSTTAAGTDMVDPFFDDINIYNLEKVRLKMIATKRQISLNRIQQDNLVTKVTPGINTTTTTMVQQVVELERINQLLKGRLENLRQDFSRILPESLRREGEQFLTKLAETSALKNEYPSFLASLSTGGSSNDSNRIQGLRSYQALKKVLMALRSQRGGSKLILLTATPMRDTPESIRYLINILRINDGKEELSQSQLAGTATATAATPTAAATMSVDLNAIARYAKGYVSRYKVSPIIATQFPEIIWNPHQHPNLIDRFLSPLYTLYLHPRDPQRSPSLSLLLCRSDPTSSQDREYRRYLEGPPSSSSREVAISGSSSKGTDPAGSSGRHHRNSDRRIQLEFRCNFGALVNRSTAGVVAAEDENYRASQFLKSLFNYQEKTYLSNFSYRLEDDEGDDNDNGDGNNTATTTNNPSRLFEAAIYQRNIDFMDPSQIGRYSVKMERLANILNQVSVREGRSGGINLIYSKFTLMGCYLIALMLEKMGYRMYPDRNLWETPPSRRLCSRCNHYLEDHDEKKGGISSDHPFKQACYLMGVKNNDEIIKHLSILRGDSNRYGEEIKIILGTQTITEGIDFRFIRYIHVFEPWYNFTRLDQIAGRGSRQGSHLGFPVAAINNSNDDDDQSSSSYYRWDNVMMLLYCYFNSDETIQTRDVLNYQRTLQKDYQIKQVERVLSKVSIDCPLLGDESGLYQDYSRDCYYNVCQKECSYLPPSIRISRAELERNRGAGVLSSILLEEIVPISSFQGKLVVGSRSGKFYLTDQPILNQLLKYGEFGGGSNLAEGGGGGGVNEEVARLWIINPKKRSSYRLIFLSELTKQIIPVIKYLLTEQYGIKQPIVRISKLTSQLMSLLSFNIDEAILGEIVTHAITLMSGVYRSQQYSLNHFIILPVLSPEYFILHPSYVQAVNSSTFYKYHYPVLSPSQRNSSLIPVNEWAPMEESSFGTVASGMTVATGVAGTAAAATTTAVGTSKPSGILSQLARTMIAMVDQAKPDFYRKYVIYSNILNHNANVLLNLNYELINYSRRLTVPANATILLLINYIAHLLEFRSLTSILQCNCGNVQHRALQPPAAVASTAAATTEASAVVLVFQIKAEQSSQLDLVTLLTNQVKLDSLGSGEVEVFKEIPNRVLYPSYGLFEYIQSKNMEIFKVHLKQREANTTTSRNCETIEKRDLILFYNQIIDQIDKLERDGVIPLNSVPYYRMINERSVNRFDPTDSTGYLSQGNLREFLCPALNYNLQYLTDYDPNYRYFNYNYLSKTALKKGRPSNSVSPMVKTKGRPKKN